VIVLVLKEATQLSVVLETIVHVRHCHDITNLPVASLHNTSIDQLVAYSGCAEVSTYLQKLIYLRQTIVNQLQGIGY